MRTVKFKLTLTSDAEPGTGLSGELIDNYLTRDFAGRPVIRASHLKGLMRDALARISGTVEGLRGPTAERLLDRCFGRPGKEGDGGDLSRIRLSDARAVEHVDALVIARTAVSDLGTAAGMTLRTAEAIPAGTCFRGDLVVDGPEDGVVDVAARLALLAVEAIGAHRTRGAGACRMDLAGDGPGDLLRRLVRLVRDPGIPEDPAPGASGASQRLDPEVASTWLRLTFRAEAPVCCPETPNVGNLLRSGFAIPASAVQGALLTRIGQTDESLANACFQDHRFRAWPLLPVAYPGSGGTLPTPVRVSFTHRISKLPRPGEESHDFKDRAIESYDWQEVPRGAPLKSADGVFLRDERGYVRLWRSADMPRLVSTHGVHADPSGARNLYTVEAMAPLVWSGLVSMPPEAAQVLRRVLGEDPVVAFGKGRSVRGHGRLEAAPLGVADLVAPDLPYGLTGRVFIAQSPLAFPDNMHTATAAHVIEQLVRNAGWGGVAETHATLGVRFGWNQLRKGRLRAQYCVLPGSVVVLGKPLDDLASHLLCGLGSGRDAGFGALLPHPGIAHDLFRQHPEPHKRKSRSPALQLGFELWEVVGDRGPSASQIGALIGRLHRGSQDFIAYLRRQEDRPNRVWRRWKPVIGRLWALVEKYDDRTVVEATLRVWQDLAVAHRKKEGQADG